MRNLFPYLALAAGVALSAACQTGPPAKPGAGTGARPTTDGGRPAPRAAAPDTLLRPQVWVLARLGDMPARPAPGFELPRLELQPTGRVSGSTGCNRLSGRYTLRGDSIRIEQVATTRRYCAGVDETGFLTALQEANRCTRDDQQLTLLRDDTPLAVFQRAE